MPWAARNLLPRLRCDDRPATVALIENPVGCANGGPPAGWVIALDRKDTAAPHSAPASSPHLTGRGALDC